MPTLRTCNASRSRHVARFGRGDRTVARRWVVSAALGLPLAACGRAPHAATGGSDSSSNGEDVSTASGGTHEASATGEDSFESSTVGDDTGATSRGFCCFDMPAACGPHCDPWAQADCPEGQKCTAIACGPGSTAWDSNVCRDVEGDKEPGALCSGGLADGADDCGAGSICWHQDVQMGEGTCVAFCQGSASAPSCDVGTTCVVFNSGVLPLCLPKCDPLGQACEPGSSCTGGPDEDGFACVPDHSGGLAPYGTPCDIFSSCNGGLTCVEAGRVPEPGCDAESGCCTPFCDVNAANTCPGVGQQCEPFYEAGTAPMGLDHVGVCAVPQP